MQRGYLKRGVKSKVLEVFYNLLRYFEMNVWQKLILLVVMLACFLEEVMAAPKKAAKAPAKPAPKPQKGGKKGKKHEEEDEEDEEDEDDEDD